MAVLPLPCWDPDDPYVVSAGFTEDGRYVIRVEAAVLPGGDSSEVQAECDRRAERYERVIGGMLPLR